MIQTWGCARGTNVWLSTRCGRIPLRKVLYCNAVNRHEGGGGEAGDVLGIVRFSGYIGRLKSIEEGDLQACSYSLVTDIYE